MDSPVLNAAHIDAEATPDRLSLWLPVDRPIWTGGGGVRSALGMMAGLCAVIGGVAWAMGVASLRQIIGNTLPIVVVWVTAMMILGIAALSGRDVVVRIGERAVDRVRPIRRLRERIVLTQHTVLTDRGEIDLSAIQGMHVVEKKRRTLLFAQTALGEVFITGHRTQRVMEGLRVSILEHAERRRRVLVAEGIDPDDPERIPASIQDLRATIPQ